MTVTSELPCITDANIVATREIPQSPNLDFGLVRRHKTRQITVLKFGSSAFLNDPLLATAVSEIYRVVRRGRRVFAVVSALPGITDQLLDSVRRRHADPHPSFLACLLSTGEIASAALLGMALFESGIPAVVMDPEQAGFRVRGPALDAEPIGFNVKRIHKTLREYPVVVFPGFFGRTATGSIALLGRGGSDFTALFAAHKLKADHCRLIKDVDGLYVSDPNASETKPRRYNRASWDEALCVGNRLVQAKALKYARDHRLAFAVSSSLSHCQTIVDCGPVCLSQPAGQRPPLRLALLGLGTVGQGVYQRLAPHRDRFQLAGVAVKDPKKIRDFLVPPQLLHHDAWSLLKHPADVVIELMGGTEPAASLIRASLESAKHVITANKDVLAACGTELRHLAASKGVQLKASASVGCGLRGRWPASLAIFADLADLYEETDHRKGAETQGTN